MVSLRNSIAFLYFKFILITLLLSEQRILTIPCSDTTLPFLSPFFPSFKDTSIKTASFNDLWTSWPSDGRHDLANSLGGTVSQHLLSSLEDDSTIRLSVAFNRCGHPIPVQSVHPGEKFAITTADGFHILDSVSAHALFFSKLGQPRNVLTQADILGRTGILCFERALPMLPKGGQMTHHHLAENSSATLHSPLSSQKISILSDHYVLWNGSIESDVTTDLWKVSPKISFWPVK